MSNHLLRESLAELGRAIAARELSPRELVDASLSRIDALNPSLNAFVTVCADQARREADSLTEELAHGRYRGPLHGIPIGVKDLTDTAGIRTTYGSKLFAEHVPALDAEPVARLRAAGAVIVGKTNTHEFACGTTTNNPHFGATHNPWRRGHVPGGSSGGSGAAVAAGLVPLATGSDTGGSIRIPSAACGCTGIKPTHGRVSLRGTYPMASSCDHVGPLARTARDCAIALEVLAAHDPGDAWSRPFATADFTSGLGRSLRGLRVAIAPSFAPVPLSPCVREAIERTAAALRSLGVEIVVVDLPDPLATMEAAGQILMAETFSQHAEQLARHRESYGPDVQLQLDFGASCTAAQLLAAQRVRARLTSHLEHLLSTRAEALLLPTLPFEAPRIGDDFVSAADGVAYPVAIGMASFTLLQNLTGLPTVAIPSGLGPMGLPTSVQLTTASAQESLALAFAHQLEPLLWPTSERWPEVERA